MLGKKAFIVFAVTVLSYHVVFSQDISINGKVNSASDVENIHVINKTRQQYTVTNILGLFKIEAHKGDTIQFSSIQHKPLEVVVSNLVFNTKKMTVYLEDNINELDEVVVGKVLTGNLASDIQNLDGKKPLNFYDLGIPGYKGKLATQSERRLDEAGEFKPKMLLGLLGGGVPLNPILNGISGRTKELKRRVDIETREELLRKVRNRIEKDFLVSNPLKQDQIDDFFYFCSEDGNFHTYCEGQTDFQILIFLRLKYRQYQENLKQTD